MRSLLCLLFATAASSRPLRTRPPPLKIRGGSEAVEGAADVDAAEAEAEAEERRAWLVEQVRRRQERVLVFSKALAERGLPFGDGALAKPPVPRGLLLEAPQWVCARATPERPRSCLIWGDAAEETVVARPKGAAGQWVTLSALNALRRTEPFKASKLWYDKYALDFRQLTAEAGPVAAALAGVLDSPRACRGLALAVLAAGLAALRGVLAAGAVALAASQMLWANYALWSPIAHAPLPLKLLMGRQLYIWVVMAFNHVVRLVRSALVELECGALERGVVVSDDAPDG